MTTAISILLRLCGHDSSPRVPRWLWDAAMRDFLALPPSDDLQAAFLSVALARPTMVQEGA